VLSTFLDRDGEEIEGVLDLRGNEGVILGEPAP
jgi:alpha-glucosidase